MFIFHYRFLAVCRLFLEACRRITHAVFCTSTARGVYIRRGVVYILNKIKIVSNKKGRIFIQRYVLKSGIRVTYKRSGSEEYRNKSLTKNWMISINLYSKFPVSHVSPDYFLICLFCFVLTLVIEASWIARV